MKFFAGVFQEFLQEFVLSTTPFVDYFSYKERITERERELKCLLHSALFSNAFLIESNLVSENPTKWSNTLKQFVGKMPTNCFNEFDYL